MSGAAPMTEAELAAIEALAEAATPGPWVYGTSDSLWWHTRIAVGSRGIECGAVVDAAFIADARTSVPRLVTEVRRLQAVAAAWKAHWQADCARGNGPPTPELEATADALQALGESPL